MQFTTLLEECLPDSLKNDVDHLLDLKMNTPEMGLGQRIDSLNEYIDESICTLDAYIRALPCEHAADWTELNRLFQQEVQLLA